ncbi:MAG: DUF4124 domain-containing protein [Burkholderiales bacterium]
MNRPCLVAALVLAAAANTAAAELIYKSSGADGAVTYSSEPVPNAVKIEKLDIKTLSAEQQRAALRLLRVEGKALESDYAARERAWNRVDREIVNATRALSRAEAALQTGREPLPGERRGNAGGGSRLSASYFERLHGLEAGVLKAKQRLDDAYRARNELRG